MNTLRTLLAPIDFSEPSREALQEAVALAEKQDAELVLLHVVQESDVPVHHVLQTSAFPNVHDEICKGAKRHLEELQKEAVPTDVRSRVLVREGLPSAQIAGAAAELDADLIVIATHGYGGIKRFLLGSTTERVIRIAGCAVLVVRGKREAEGKGYRKIVMTTDFSECSETALPNAVALAEGSQGTIFLLHVIRPLPWPATETIEAGSYPLVSEALRKAATDKLKQLRDTQIPKTVKCESHVLEGNVEEEIVRFATEHDADIISIASEGHGGIKRFLLGSTTERIAQAAPCAVLVARKSLAR
jgi:nucleotide-binding universal stress UspA family protein